MFRIPRRVTISNFKFQISNFKNGFSIIEVIIVLGFVGIFLTAVIPLFFDVITINKRAEYNSTAYKLLDSNIENLRAGGFDSLTTGDCPLSPDTLPGGATCDVIVSDVETDLKEVKVTVNWNFKGDQSVDAITYIAREGIKR